jgi:hypothetical protein
MATLAQAAGLGAASEGARALASKFVASVKAMNAEMKIPTFAQGLTEADVTEVATRALKEAHGDLYAFGDAPLKWALDIGYPVPKWMTHDECEAIVRKCIGPPVSKL